MLNLLGEHKSDAEIAQALGITEETVRKHTAMMRAKLGLRTRRELYAWLLHFRER